MKAGRERRRSPRVTSEFLLRFRQIPVGRAGYVDASVEDLSIEGVRFRCSREVRVHSSLIFELLIPGSQPVHAFGRAAWVRERPGHDGFDIGGKFEDQSTSARKMIERHLQSRYPAAAC